MTTAQIALSIVMIVASLFLIVVVLLQNGAQQGLGAISGGAETFFGSGKATAADKIFARLTSVVGVIFVIAALVLNPDPLRWKPSACALCHVRRIRGADDLSAASVRHDLRPHRTGGQAGGSQGEACRQRAVVYAALRRGLLGVKYCAWRNGQ